MTKSQFMGYLGIGATALVGATVRKYWYKWIGNRVEDSTQFPTDLDKF